MRLALEALEFDGFTPEDQTHRTYTTKAITALREALADNALNKLAENELALGLDYTMTQPGVGIGQAAEEAYKAAKERGWVGVSDERLMEMPAQDEPVALETVYETIIQWDEGGGKRSRRELARRIAALYTCPPAREPLTVVEIMREWNSAKNSVVEFARAIEAAHGIGEKK